MQIKTKIGIWMALACVLLASHAKAESFVDCDLPCRQKRLQAALDQDLNLIREQETLIRGGIVNQGLVSANSNNSNRVWIQVASLDANKHEQLQAWDEVRRLRDLYPFLTNGNVTLNQRSNIRFWAIRFGPYSESNAKRLCNQLVIQHNAGCLIVKNK